MYKVLINDGIHPKGEQMLKDAGFHVDNFNIPKDELMQKLPDYDVICVRSATKVRKDLIDNCPNLKIIGRGGVGLDNIDVEHAKENGIAVINTPSASSRSVAELVFSHAMGLNRFLHKSNRDMPVDGNGDFKTLKKSYSKGKELEGKTLGVIGIGRIGQATAKIGLGLGMKVVAFDSYITNPEIKMQIQDQEISVIIPSVSLDELLAQSDMISLHIPFTGEPVLSSREFNKMKKGVMLINASRGGTVDEDALIEALNNETVCCAGVDVFVGEPHPRQDILDHPDISLTPHTGASTLEAQERVGTDLAKSIIDQLNVWA